MQKFYPLTLEPKLDSLTLFWFLTCVYYAAGCHDILTPAWLCAEGEVVAGAQGEGNDFGGLHQFSPHKAEAALRPQMRADLQQLGETPIKTTCRAMSTGM